MNLIINPGSGDVGTQGEGWTNTRDQSKINAYEQFYKPMIEEGFTDITVKDTKQYREGRWVYEFTHDVTGKTIELEMHGIDNMEAYMKEHIFGTRIYWNGSSSSNPELEQFAEEGFVPVKTFRKKS